MIKMIDDRCQQLNSEVQEEKAIRHENLGVVEAEIKELDEELATQIETEKIKSQEGDKDLITKVEEELSKAKKELLEQTESRESCESEIYELMKNVVVKIKEEIEAEKKGREASQEQLLNTLEELCQKIEVMSKNNMA